MRVNVRTTTATRTVHLEALGPRCTGVTADHRLAPLEISSSLPPAAIFYSEATITRVDVHALWAR